MSDLLEGLRNAENYSAFEKLLNTAPYANVRSSIMSQYGQSYFDLFHADKDSEEYREAQYNIQKGILAGRDDRYGLRAAANDLKDGTEAQKRAAEETLRSSIDTYRQASQAFGQVQRAKTFEQWSRISDNDWNTLASIGKWTETEKSRYMKFENRGETRRAIEAMLGEMETEFKDLMGDF